MTRIFLLGGYDLEMITIRDLLESRGEIYYDKQLQWENAILPAYQDILKQHGNKEGVMLYGIELRAPAATERYVNYTLIDHHNELYKKPAALIQVSQVLGCELTHYQQLVAANDSDYIPGMTEMGATPNEIEQIRQLDRLAQGVTEKDEWLAEKSIGEKMSRIDDLIVVESQTSHFSPICDRLYPYEKLFIFAESEWMYYGKEFEKVVQLFHNELKSGKLFYGGCTNGFAGVRKGAFSKQEILEMKDKIIETKK